MSETPRRRRQRVENEPIQVVQPVEVVQQPVKVVERVVVQQPAPQIVVQQAAPIQQPTKKEIKKRVHCPKCGSTEIQFNTLSDTHTKKRKHGIFYWILFGWLFSLILWILLFIPRLIIRIFRPKKVETTFKYEAVCMNCGHHWERK